MKKDKKKEKEAVGIAAERLAEIFIKQIELKKKSKSIAKRNNF